MDSTRRTQRAKTAVLFGFGLIGLGLFFNEFFISWTFSPDGVLQARTLFYIRLMNIAFAGLGLLVILGRRRWNVVDALAWAGTRFPRFTALTAGCLVAVAMVGLVEAVFYSLNGRRAIAHRIEQQYLGDLHHFDPVLGFRAAPETTVREVMACNGEQLFEATYRFDSAGRRAVPDADVPDTTAPCVLFFGGSFVFGVGCDDADTLPAQFARATSDVAVYNYGFPGYGPGQMLAQLESGEVSEQVGTGREAIGVYVFIAGHVSRAIGSMRVTTTWGRHFPCYKRMEDGRYVLLGSFQSARPVRMWLYDLLAREQVLKYFEADVPRGSQPATSSSRRA